MCDITAIKDEICEIGRRIYDRGFAAGNDGNISFRLTDDTVLCTPTMISKGRMTPDDLCTVDANGKQLSGRRKTTSEILMHLRVYQGQPAAKAVVHCHPPHATAFGVAHEDIPSASCPRSSSSSASSLAPATKLPAARTSPTPSARFSARPTLSCSIITASSVGDRPSNAPTGTSRSSTPTAGCCYWPSRSATSNASPRKRSRNCWPLKATSAPTPIHEPPAIRNSI